MEAMKVRALLDSEIIHIPIHPNMIGKRAEVIILIESPEIDADKPSPRGSTCRKPGSAKGLIQISDDFQDPLGEDILKEFYK